MANYFVPYSGNKPAAVLINGHRLVILSRDQDLMRSSLDMFGADRLRKVDGGSTEQEETAAFSKIAENASAGVVVAPREIEVTEIIKNLESQLPWLQ